MNVALLAAIVGLLSLLATDQFNSWNKDKYKAEKKAGYTDGEAFDRNRRRKIMYDRFSFWTLMLAACLSIYTAIFDKRESDDEIRKLATKSAQLETQLQRIQNSVEVRKTETREIATQLKQIDSQLARTLQFTPTLDKVKSLEKSGRVLRRHVASLERKLRAIDTERCTK